jgi:aspartate--ammonia ligase
MVIALDKKADLAAPGIGNYDEIEKILPTGYKSLLDPKETQIALSVLKRYIEDHLAEGSFSRPRPQRLCGPVGLG